MYKMLHCSFLGIAVFPSMVACLRMIVSLLLVTAVIMCQATSPVYALLLSPSLLMV